MIQLILKYDLYVEIGNIIHYKISSHSYNINDNIITKRYFYNKKNYLCEIINNINNDDILEIDKENIKYILVLIKEEINIIDTYNIRSLLKKYKYKKYYKYIPYLIRK